MENEQGFDFKRWGSGFALAFFLVFCIVNARNEQHKRKQEYSAIDADNCKEQRARSDDEDFEKCKASATMFSRDDVASTEQLSNCVELRQHALQHCTELGL